MQIVKYKLARETPQSDKIEICTYCFPVIIQAFHSLDYLPYMEDALWREFKLTNTGYAEFIIERKQLHEMEELWDDIKDAIFITGTYGQPTIVCM